MAICLSLLRCSGARAGSVALIALSVACASGGGVEPESAGAPKPSADTTTPAPAPVPSTPAPVPVPTRAAPPPAGEPAAAAPANPKTLAIAQRAVDAATSGDVGEGARILVEGVATARASGWPDREVLYLAETLTALYDGSGRHDALLDHLESSVDYHEGIAPDSYATGFLTWQLGRQYRRIGRPEDAVVFSKRAEGIFAGDPPVVDEFHPPAADMRLRAIEDAAQALEEIDRADEAESLYRRAIEVAGPELGESVGVARLRNRLGQLYATSDRCGEALPLFREALPITRAHDVDADAVLPRLLWGGSYVRCLIEEGERKPAEYELPTLRGDVTLAAGRMHYSRSAPLIFDIARSFETREEWTFVEAIIGAQLEGYGNLPKAPVGAVIVAWSVLGTSVGKLGRTDEAEALFERALRLIERLGRDRRGAELEVLCLDRYVSFLTEAGRTGAAGRMRRRGDEARAAISSGALPGGAPTP